MSREADKMSPLCSNTPTKPSAFVKVTRVQLMFVTICHSGELTVLGPAGLTIAGLAALVVVGLGMTMPLNKADQAARPAKGLNTAGPITGLFVCRASTFTDSVPRVALSLNAVVNRSNNSRSCTGAELSASKYWP